MHSINIERDRMKFDMHCHTHEGSVDSNVSVERYIKLLMDQGYDGMLITDHDSYDGYRYYAKHLKNDSRYKDFVVLRGVEYDTYNAGHFIVVLPSDEEPKFLEHKGLKVDTLIEAVHSAGGILGPAHPFGENFLSIYNTGRFKRDKSITAKFDFIEGFNSQEDYVDNGRAVMIARRFGKPVFSGTDSHNESNVGKATTYFDADIRTEDDLIKYIKEGGRPQIEGTRWYGTLKDYLGILNKTLVYGFFFYNKAGAFYRLRKRRQEFQAFLDKHNIDLLHHNK